jgi:Protein of unknown function (DUF2510)
MSEHYGARATRTAAGRDSTCRELGQAGYTSSRVRWLRILKEFREAPGKHVAVTADIAHRIPAGWYPDREDRSRRRWWNGIEWTDYYSANPDAQAPRLQTHTLRRAITFKDRVAACTLAGLLASNLVLLALVSHLL